MYVIRVISEDECPSKAWTVPSEVPRASCRVAFACRSQCQVTPVKPSDLHTGLNWRLSRLRRQSGEPFAVEKTNAEGCASMGRNRARIPTHSDGKGTVRLLRLVFGSSKCLYEPAPDIDSERSFVSNLDLLGRKQPLYDIWHCRLRPRQINPGAKLITNIYLNL